jgi:hypothetical protein
MRGRRSIGRIASSVNREGVFFQALQQLAEGLVPVDGDQSDAVGQRLSKAGQLDDLAQLEVVVRAHANLLVAADLAVGGGSHEVKGPDADVGRALGIANRPGPHIEQEIHAERDDERLQEPRGHAGLGRRGEVVDVLGQRQPDCPPQRARLEEDVGVGEEEPLAARAVGPELQGVVFAEPAGGQLRQMHDVELRKLRRQAPENLARPIGRAVVDKRDFQAGIVERGERTDGPLDVPLFVAGRSDERDAGPLGEFGNRLLAKFWGTAAAQDQQDDADEDACQVEERQPEQDLINEVAHEESCKSLRALSRKIFAFTSPGKSLSFCSTSSNCGTPCLGARKSVPNRMRS